MPPRVSGTTSRSSTPTTRELYGRMIYLLDPPRIDSPESDGEGSWEGPDFHDGYDDEDDDDEDWS